MDISIKQEQLFKALSEIKNFNVELYTSFLYKGAQRNGTLQNKEFEYLENKIDINEIEALKKIQNELIEMVIYQIIELVDGYGKIDFKLDLVDRETGESVRGKIELHDKFMDYLETQIN